MRPPNSKQSHTLQLRLLLQLAYLQPALILLHNVLIVVLSTGSNQQFTIAHKSIPDRSSHLPELLRRVLAAHAREDLGSAGMLVDEAAQLVDAVVDDDVKALVDCAVLRYLLLAD